MTTPTAHQLELFAELPPTTLVVVVPCSAAKRPGLWNDAGELVTAGERYTGTFHTYARNHAARLGADRVLILSAEYGLIPLDRPLPDYERTIDDPASIISRPGQVAHQALRYGLLEPGTVVVSLCPAAYTRILAGAVPELVTPLAGSRGIGEQRGRIARLERSEVIR